MLIVIYSTNRSSTESSAMFFFFSSRRRHTRYWRDWSSDVCSSDLNSIRACNILMIPGGFSAGDEPDGSAKFIATAFRNDFIKEEVDNLINVRSEEHTSELQSRQYLVCRLLLEKKKKNMSSSIDLYQ